MSMQWGEQQNKGMEQPARGPSGVTQPHLEAFGVNATTAPPLDPQTTMQRGDEVTAVQRMLSDSHTSAVMLLGTPGVGKSTLANLLYQHIQAAKQQGQPAPRYLVWLTLGTYSTLPDIIAAILSGVNMQEAGLFLLKPEQQVTIMLRALRRSQHNALIVLDQFEVLLHPETNQGVAGRGALPAFLEMLQTDLGASRFLLTSYSLPYDEQKLSEPRVRSYQVSRISLPEGIALLQRRGIKGSPEELSFVWQRCMGNVFALILFHALLQLSGISLSYVLVSPDYQAMWAGDVAANLTASVYYFLNPIQRAIMHVLSLFYEPVPLEGIVMTITGNANGTTPGSSYNFKTFEREIELLRHAGLVQLVSNSTGVANYTVHSLMRQYVLEHFLEEGNHGSPDDPATLTVSMPPKTEPANPEAQRVALAAGHTQVAAYYRFVADNYGPSREQRKGLQDVTALVATIRHLCLGWRWQRACDLLFEQGLHESMVQWGAWNTLIGLYTAMLPPFGVLLRHDEGIVASHVAMLYGRMGEAQQSKQYFEQALAIQRQIGDQRGEATTLANQGELQRMRGEFEQAHVSLERALELNKAQPDANLRCILLHNLGLLSHQEKHFEQALRYYTEALQLASNLDNKQYTGMILTNLGMLLYEQQQLQDALAILLAALQLRIEIEDPTAPMLERFLVAVEQKMGPAKYTQATEEALRVQQDVFSRFAFADM